MTGRATREENKEQRRTTAIFIHPHPQGQSWATQKIGSPSVPFHCSSLFPFKSHTQTGALLKLCTGTPVLLQATGRLPWPKTKSPWFSFYNEETQTDENRHF